MFFLGLIYKISIYLMVGAFVLVPLYFIMIPLIIGTGVHRIKNDIPCDDLDLPVVDTPAKKEIQWIVREETDNEKRRTAKRF